MSAELESAGATLHVVPMRRISTSHGPTSWLLYLLAWPLSVARLWRLAHQLRSDVVHSNSLHSWYGWAAAWLARKPHIWHAREIVVQSATALRLERFLARHFARRVLAVSAAVASQLDPANVVVVHEEADPAEFFPARAGRARAAFGLADDSLLVGYVGRVDTWKGVDILLDAMALLRAGRVAENGPGAPSPELVIAGGAVAGKEAYSASLAERAAALGARWLGPLPGPTAADVIADLDVLAYPSTEPEPWGLVLVEALASGTPAVGTSAGGAREILAGLPAEAGLLVPPRDPAALATAIARLLPASTSSELRRTRPVLRAGEPAPYPELFADVVDAVAN
jgi:glycosyltransferase involved in cell wall biosynthesis